MRNTPFTARGLAVLALALTPFLFFSTRQLRADMDEDIGSATDAGINWLLKAIEAKQAETGEHDDKKMGKMALETYALVVAGVSVDHPTVQKNFEALSHMGLDQTYSIACYIFALDAAISQLQNDAAMAAPSQNFKDDPSIGAAYRPRLEAGVNALVRIRQASGGWNYTAGGSRFDNSNSQFAVLGLGVGAKRKVSIPKEVWEQVAQHFIKCQKKDGPEVKERLEFYPEDEKGEGKRDRVNIVDKKTGEKVEKGKKSGKDEEKKEKKGSPTVVLPPKPTPDFGPEVLQYFSRGWDYTNGGGENWNMTCGGLSSIILAEESLRGQVSPEFQNQINKSIRDGYGWVMTHWNPLAGGGWKYYGIYSLEKVADLGEVKKFAGHDWFQDVAQHILADQRQDGSWPGGNAVQIRWNSAFALLVLNRATSLLTQGRVVAGKKQSTRGALGGPRKDENSDERNWVYIPEFEREFHIPTILRYIKLRPSPKLLKILELALKNYPEDQNGYLVTNLVQNRDAQRNKQVKQFLDDWLVKITGVKYDSSDKYIAWCNRWVDVNKMGLDQKDPEGLLAKFYAKTTQSVPLKKKIQWAIQRCRKEKNVQESTPPPLIEDLSNADQDIRMGAYETLSMLPLSKEPIPVYDAKAPPETREPQVLEIKAWYTNRKPVAAAAEQPKKAEEPKK